MRHGEGGALAPLICVCVVVEVIKIAMKVTKGVINMLVFLASAALKMSHYSWC